MNNHSSLQSTQVTGALLPASENTHETPLSEFEKYRRMQMEQFEDDIADGRCYPEMPEGQFVRGK